MPLARRRDDRQPDLGPVHQPGPRPWSSSRPHDPRASRCRPAALACPPEQRAPIGERVKYLRPLTRAPYRSLPDPAAYLDAPTNRRRTPKQKINYRNEGLTGPLLQG
jgi:hypothetical protein